MKTLKTVLTALPLIAAFFMAGCADMLMERPEAPSMAEGEGLLVVSLAGVNVGTSPRTMLPADPQFTRYELDVSGSIYPFYNSTFQIPLDDGPYSITAKGYEGDKLVAKSASQSITISAGNITPITFTLKPYMDTAADPIPGVLNFSLNWDGLSRMPYRAELLVEEYADANGALIGPTPISGDIIPTEFASEAGPGFIRLLDRDSAVVNLTGALTLPPGEYRLTMSVTMDPGTTPAIRLDFAHIYSNLTTPAPFYYGGGDLYVSNTSPDSGASFITGFTFNETPNATTVIGSEPGLDGTRMIMIMAPAGTDLTQLTPIVTCATGSFITSPVPATLDPVLGTPNLNYGKGEIDFSGPTIWTAQAKNGAVQKYTVVVSDTPDTSDDKMITNFFFKNYPDIPGNIEQTTGIITVMLPHGSSVNPLIPIVTIIGKSVAVDGSVNPPDGTNAFDFSSDRIFKVYSEHEPAINPKTYTVKVTVALNNAAEIISFAIDGYPERVAIVGQGINPGSLGDQGTIEITLPYGVSLKDRTPLIQYKGKTLNPASGVRQNFSGPIDYTVTADNGSTKTYHVTITNDAPDKNTGIFDFRVTNVPSAKVVIGQKPRQDGKIPIVIQVPFGTDETNMTAAITLSSQTSTISPGSGPINFGSPNYQEAVYTVTSQGGAAEQDYVVVVSEGPQYYYVDGTNGDDTWPDIYNGGSESHPFKTLAYAVAKAATDGIGKIFIKGNLTPTNGGNTADDSAFTLDLTSAVNKKLTIASVTGSTLRGSANQRVLTVKGGAELTFENISITGGNTTGSGGGLYITGNSKVKFSGGSITGNTAASGGGVYVEGDTGAGSEFTFMDGEISGNTATSVTAGNTDATLPNMGGGGGVYVKGDALFWFAGGTIANNTAKGAGGGVLVNGNVVSVPTLTESGFLMSGGKIVSNKSTSTTYPHGGGGVYVAKGAFEMLNGEITGNTATRQGGGVFVHWGQARFTASGNSTITGNEGVGSSKAICNRGTTEMLGKARADKVYIWNYDGVNPEQSFTLTPDIQIDGIVLAYSANHKNYITLLGDSWPGTNTICTIDLESHLNNSGSFAGQLEPDWLDKKIITGSNAALTALVVTNNRLPLNSFTGQPSVYNLSAHYKIAVSGTDGKFKRK